MTVLQVGEDKVKELAEEAAAAIAGDVAAGSQQLDADGAASARHAAEEARMLQLLAERAAMLEQAKVGFVALRAYIAEGDWHECHQAMSKQ